MADRRPEIPSWAFINAQIIQDAERSGALAASVRRVEQGYSLPAGSFRVINSAYMVSLLYCMIVVPKELWLRTTLPPEIAKLESSILPLIIVTQHSSQFEGNPLFTLLRHLRNALSHVRFEIADNGDFSFWDQSNESAAPSFRATMSVATLEKFLSVVGAALANLRTSKGDGSLH